MLLFATLICGSFIGGVLFYFAIRKRVHRLLDIARLFHDQVPEAHRSTDASEDLRDLESLFLKEVVRPDAR